MNKPVAFQSLGSEHLSMSGHALRQAILKGFTHRQVKSALTAPEKITPVTRYPGQWRYCGAGIAIVVDFTYPVPTIRTMYLDGVVTPLRPDQMNDPKALASRRVFG